MFTAEDAEVRGGRRQKRGDDLLIEGAAVVERKADGGMLAAHRALLYSYLSYLSDPLRPLRLASFLSGPWIH